LFSLDRDTFRFTVAHGQNDRISAIKAGLKRVAILEGLTDEQLDKLTDSVEIVNYEAGEQIIKKGSEGNVFYMIKEGSAAVKNVGSGTQFSDQILKEGDYFGERALLTGEPRAANIFAETKVSLMALGREEFHRLLGPLKELLDMNMTMRVLSSVKIFEKLTKSEKEKVCTSFTLETFGADSSIITEGEKGTKFYILKDGSAEVVAGGVKLCKLEPGTYFGEMALLDDEVRKASVLAITKCECFVIDRNTFNKIMGSLTHVMARETMSRLEKLSISSNTLDTFPLTNYRSSSLLSSSL
jgi:CRP-like cAMP-binding protein